MQQRGNIVLGNRPAEQIALHLVASERPQEFSLIFRIHAFRDDLRGPGVRSCLLPFRSYKSMLTWLLRVGLIAQ
ncbi:MAG: hypothetical protein A2W68_08680 [Betaproteobacteria bacterium RIFCSPLOWO2_02_64_14]|nr:MAG: hypothetical protein A2W68_08680 [Betaproteobacteria bacterium RIFCSPLOWO2_02_64_14]